MSDNPERAGAPEKITPAMIEAGLAVIDASFGGLRDPLLRIERADLVREIYEAMQKIASAALVEKQCRFASEFTLKNINKFQKTQLKKFFKRKARGRKKKRSK